MHVFCKADSQSCSLQDKVHYTKHRKDTRKEHLVGVLNQDF